MVMCHWGNQSDELRKWEILEDVKSVANVTRENETDGHNRRGVRATLTVT
jgi:hypothetical protein